MVGFLRRADVSEERFQIHDELGGAAGFPIRVAGEFAGFGFVELQF